MLKAIILGFISIIFALPNLGLLEYAPPFNKISFIISMASFGLMGIFAGAALGKKERET